MHELGAPWLSSAAPFIVPVFAQEKGRDPFPVGTERRFFSTDPGFSCCPIAGMRRSWQLEQGLMSHFATDVTLCYSLQRRLTSSSSPFKCFVPLEMLSWPPAVTQEGASLLWVL